MNIMDMDVLMEALHDRRLDIVSEATGVHVNTLGKIKRGEQMNPQLKTLKALSDYFRSSCYGGCEDE